GSAHLRRVRGFPAPAAGQAPQRDRRLAPPRSDRDAVRHHDRGPRPDRRHLLHHERARRAGGAEEPPRGDEHRRGRVAPDGPFGAEGTHPRAYGSATRILGHYVRDLKLIPLEFAVRKMTSLAAQRVGLTDRGLLKPGMAADITVFDPATVADRATFDNPHRPSVGIAYVYVNGQKVLDHGKLTAARPGRGLRGPGYLPPHERR